MRADPNVFKYLAVALPRVCRHIYAETSVLMYAVNTFGFKTPEKAVKWLQTWFSAQLNAVRFIALPSDPAVNGSQNTRIETIKTMCPMLKDIVVEEGIYAEVGLTLLRRSDPFRAESSDEELW
jgi:hypothetical protein